MSIYKRNNTYWYNLTLPNGQRIQRSTRTKVKREAQELFDKVKYESWRVSSLGEKQQKTWKEACVKWRKDKADKKSLVDDISKMRWLDTYFSTLMLHEITKDKIEHIKELKLNEGWTNATVNRYLAFIKTVLKTAKDDWEWIDSHPKIKLLKEPTRRIRFLKDDEVITLLRCLPEHLKHITIFALATGLRKSNITNLKWSEVDLSGSKAWVYSDEVKSDQSVAVPLNSDALKIIESQKGKNDEYVFTYKGKYINQVNTKAWRKGLVQAGISDFRFHDLRHTWATNHVQSGTPLHELQELGGWKTVEMVRKYAHFTSERLSKFAQNLPSHYS